MGKKMRVGWETREEDHLRKCGKTGRTASRFSSVGGKRKTEKREEYNVSVCGFDDCHFLVSSDTIPYVLATIHS